RGRTLMDALYSSSGGPSITFPAAVPIELQQICRRALAHDPAARYADIESFQAALRDYLENRESRALVARAEEGLVHWREAMAGGIDNAAARSGELVSRRAWAEAAFACGDLGVATTAIEGILDAGADDLRRRIDG